jgi:protein-S-isoprenylcysteine O-methyltransferase Ste14
MTKIKTHKDGQRTTTDSLPVGPSRHVAWIFLVVPVTLVVLFFFASRRYGWTLGWLYIGMFAANGVFSLLCTLVWNPVLLLRRAPIRANTKRWDIGIHLLMSACIVAAYWVASTDRADRVEIADVPGILWLAASFVFAIGLGLMTWCGVVNPFLEKTVRIQTDNEHCVVQTGPYAFVRHPFYVGCIAVILATPVMLASAWTHIPCIALVVVLFVRTALEDRTLQAELPGYREYAERVRYRLIPGVF